MALYRTVPYSNLLYRTVPYRTVLPCRTVPYRTVPYRTVPYRTVPYRTVLTRTVNGNICHQRESNLRRNRLTLQIVKNTRTEKALGKSVEMDDSNTFGQKCWSRPSKHFFPNTFSKSVERKYGTVRYRYHVKDELDVFPYDLYEFVYIIVRKSVM